MDQTSPAGLFTGAGVMETLFRERDWSATPLGPVDSWSPALRTTVRMLLVNRFPLLLWWGPDYVQLYNDAYRPIPGAKHPVALGQPGRECWAEIWHILGPLVDTPFQGGPATWMEDIPLVINRHGFFEETHFTIAYSPVPDESVSSGIGGVLATVHEITEKVIAERRVVALRDLGRAAEAKTAEEACAIAGRTLAGHDLDVPFALLYLLDPDRTRARLAGVAGVAPGAAIAPVEIDLGAPDAAWPLFGAIEDDAPRVVERLGARFAAVPTGPWPDPPDKAVVLPIPSNKPRHPVGALVAGLSARLAFDESFTGFIELVTGQVASAIANARAYDEERKRAEALAEIDRAKTQFFSNVSHEFRTPLTLLLGPLEDALRSPAKALTDRSLAAAHRNALRLLRLVNALLDFSRIEAGRARARFAPVDLASATAELASVFRSAIERAGLRFRVACEPIDEAVYVDHDMWEKIVLNLLSNALKFTFEGEIEVGLRRAGSRVELSVRDTGIGIPESEIPRLFERFHRIEGTRARTHEGSGIGLALVRELARMHGGEILVASTHGRGSVFTVALPVGATHLPAEQIVSAPGARRISGAGAFLDEALLWLPADQEPKPAAVSRVDARVLIVDDNRDMREYLERLVGESFAVETASDGEEAVEALQARAFDLVLTDVMMPRLDGFGLLSRIRATPALARLPVVMLSARAGEEAKVDGLTAGADDYLIKPFSARELLARVATQVELSRARRRLEEQSAALAESLRRAAEEDRRKNEFLATLAHELRNPLAPVMNSLEIMKRARGNPDLLETTRATMTRQMRQMNRLIDDLLDISRISRDELELKKERVSLGVVLEHALEVSRPSLEGAGHALTVTGTSEPLYLDADAVRLTQVFGNLLTNACKYTDPGGRIDVAVERSGDEVVVRVTDTGVGIPPDRLSLIFERFVQLAPSVERARGGVGLGLALAKQLAELHGGTIAATSDGVGRGSTFTVRLPLSADQVAAPDPVPPPDDTTALSPRRILVVDDNEDSVTTLALLLQLSGHATEIAHDGLEAMEKAASYRPDVILLDLGLPGMTGYDVCRAVRAEEWGRDIAVIALTGWGQAEDRRKTAEAGFTGHLVKPVEQHSLVALLAAATLRS
ncbi:MAG TPA: ATP-binding protein [Candidatus Polarisedimenticolaceae bacterium]|nr:ATP-binding protein [Candidatus Polarisedimenticolaceae bacterium]